MKTLRTLETELLANPDTRAEYEAQAGKFDLAHALIAARTRAGLTQAQVAERMGTTQRRLEGGRRTPSLRAVRRYAQAIGYRAVVQLERMEAGMMK